MRTFLPWPRMLKRSLQMTNHSAVCIIFKQTEHASRKKFAKTDELAVPQVPNILHEDSAHHYSTRTVLFTSNYLQRSKSLMQCYCQHNGNEPHKAGPVQMKEWFLSHNNAPSCNGVTVTQFPAYTKTAMLYHPSYSPDLTLANYFLFPN